MATVQVPPSPGVGARRRGPKSLPKLPLSAFTPPSSGVSDRFPLPPSPSTVHPSAIVDGLADLARPPLPQTAGIVVQLPLGEDAASALQRVSSISLNAPILTAVIPLDLENGPPKFELSAFTDSNIPIAILSSFTGPSPSQREGISWALSKGLTVIIDVKCNLIDGDVGWEALEELVGSCAKEQTGRATSGVMILSNILPPPRTLDIPLVKLLNHPSYRAYQTRLASLSLVPFTYINFLPPDWNAETPATPPPPEATLSPIATPSTPTAPPVIQDSKEKREWKRRIKMYLGPAVEAFGFQRVIFGTSAVSSSSKTSDWYELARESLAELGVEQESIDQVFYENAKSVYGKKST